MQTTTSLPPLTGSPKQIPWAEKIRTEIVAYIDELIAKTRAAAAADPSKTAQYDVLIAAVEAHIQTLTSAGWWLDNRHNRGVLAWRSIWAVGVEAARDIT